MLPKVAGKAPAFRHGDIRRRFIDGIIQRALIYCLRDGGLQVEQSRRVFAQVPCRLVCEVPTQSARSQDCETLHTGSAEGCSQYKAEIMALEMRPDHVHMLVEIDPQWGIHRLVKNLKGVSSHDLRKEFASLRSRLPTLWTNRYFVSTVGSAPRSARKQYVENQKNV
jgi:putative transposase